MAKWQTVAEGDVFDLASLNQYESSFAEGQRGLLSLQLRTPATQEMADYLESALVSAGVEGVKVTTGSPVLNVLFKKGFPWLAVIATTILALSILAVLIVGWRLFKEVVPEAAQFPVALVLLGIATVVAIGYVRRR